MKPWRPALVGLALLATGCDAERRVVYDLAQRVAVAERESFSRQVVLFGTPQAQTYEAEGFHPWAGGSGDRYVWARREVEVAIHWDDASSRVGVVDLAPFPGVAEQGVRVLLNGVEIEAFGLGPQRRRYRLGLPAESQVVGENRLRFEFEATASLADIDPSSGDTGQLAAAFYSLTLGAADDGGLEDLLRRGAPVPFARADEGGVPGFVQVGRSRVGFAVRVPEAAELRVAPRLHVAARGSGRAARARVSLETVAGERELWSGELREGAPIAELTIALEADAGDFARVAFDVEGGHDGRMTWVEWQAPRVLGASAALRKRTVGAREAADWLLERLGEKNVVLIVLDAARATQLGAYGYDRDTTPEIDRIAREGVVLDRVYTPAVYTLGAMSAVWTSQHPDRHRTETSFSARLPASRLTLAELLSARGIHTAGFVANAVAGEAFGFERGFSEFHEVYREQGSGADAFREAVPRFWKERGAQRFFAYIHFREPHFPYDPRPPFDTRFGPEGPIPKAARSDMDWWTDVNQGRRELTEEARAHLVSLYDGNLAYVDAEIGRVRRDLERAGLWDETVIIVTADHGEALWEHDWVGHNVQLYEESVHVPLVVRFPPGTGPAGVRFDEFADLTAVGPTIAELFGALGEGGSDEAFEGKSLIPLIAGGPGAPFVVSRTVWNRPSYALRDAEYKFILNTATGEAVLYDLTRDLGEREDVTASEPLVAAYYREQLYEWMARLVARPEAGGVVAPTEDQCRNISALGYISACQ